jgi:hypothetical protein
MTKKNSTKTVRLIQEKLESIFDDLEFILEYDNQDFVPTPMEEELVRIFNIIAYMKADYNNYKLEKKDNNT